MAATGGAIRDAINDINSALQAFVSEATDLAESFARQASTFIAELAETVDPEVRGHADPTPVVQQVVQHLHHHIDGTSMHIGREVSRLLALLDD